MLYPILSLITVIPPASVAFYVSPDGDDSWSGRLPAPDENRTDGPFASLERARDAAREIEQPVIVYLRGGTHFLTKPLTLTPEDSGDEGRPIVYSSYPGEKAVISGGRRIEGWRETILNGRKLWVAEIPDVREGKWFFRQIWVNGQRRRRARHPKSGYLSVAEMPDVPPQTPWNEGQTRIRFREGELKAWNTIGDAELVLMTRWVESHLPIVEVDEEAKIVTFGKKTVFRPDPGDLYYVENALELLDEPGEWYLNPKEGKLYYMPLHDERIDEAEVIAPVLAQLIRIEGEPEKGRFVENLTFRNLTFSHTEWPIPEDRSGFSQAAVGVPGAIWGEGMRNCSFEGCALKHLGTYGIELARGCKFNRIEGCEISDIGAGGIKIGETVIRDDEPEQTHDNTVSNCHIHNGGLIFHSAIGIWIGQSYNNVISHNHLHDFYYSGLSVGWTWGYGRSLAGGNIIQYNHVHHIGVRSDGDGPILSDMGGIYTLGIQEGTVIRNNLFHDIAGFRYGGWGIYFDEGSTHILAENNLVYRTTHGGFHQHYGRENVVRNNIFALARDHQIQRSRAEEHQSFTFERNIVYWRRGILIAGNLSDLHFTFDRNLYWCEGGGEIRIGNMSWDEWRRKGMDVNSIVADPRFVDPEGDYRLRPDSPAFKLGFVPFDIPDPR